MTNTYQCGSIRLERATQLDRWRAHRTLVINGRGAGAFTQPCRLQSAGVCDPAEVFRYRGTLSAHTTRDPDLRALLCGGSVGPLPVCVPAVCLAWPRPQAASLIPSDFVVHSFRPPMEEAMSRLWSQLG